jgi:hypothetical protein
VDCQLDTLRKCITISAVERALTELPNTLDETYNRILNNIPEEYHKEARRVMQLLAISYRPLTIDEVAEAIAVDCENEVFDPEKRLPDQMDILEICSSLVTLSGYFHINISVLSNI